MIDHRRPNAAKAGLTMRDPLRRAVVIAILGIAQACSSESRDLPASTTPLEPVVANETPKPPATDAVTVELTASRPVTIAAFALVIELTEVADSRCPVGTRCVWAGHAAVTLRVGKPDGNYERIVIGTEAPASMSLPFEVDFGGYRFGLVQLEPAPHATEPVPLTQYRATVRVAKRDPLPTP